ncbi:MAG: class I SAM-dependent methyltransferase [Bryobacterales bacterium]|nr:class I SAM-dependent methyltransferase [Bryobacterales bacterium]
MYRFSLGLGIATAVCGVSGWAQTGMRTPDLMAKKLAPYVQSPQAVVERMLELAKVKPGETVYDLGCGDGRILVAAAKRFSAKAVGVELSESLVRRARAEAQKQGVAENVTVIQGDMMTVDVAPANVVALYLITEANDQLRPKLERELKPGSRVVSLDFKVRGWKPKAVEQYEAHHRKYTIYVYQMGSL